MSASSHTACSVPDGAEAGLRVPAGHRNLGSLLPYFPFSNAALRAHVI